VASRQEEKQRRRAEREARERAEAAAAARRKRLQLVFGGVLAVLVVAAVIALAVAGLGGGGDDGGPQRASADAGASVPAQRISDLSEAADAAGCVVRSVPIEGSTHETKAFKASDYKTNPPTSGNHNPTWYQDGVYVPGTTPRLGMLVHTLEHGRIDVQYAPGASESTSARLEALVNQLDDGYHMLLFQNTTRMPYAVAATAWGHLLGCKTMNDHVFDAIRAFRTSYIDKGPEKVA
jgi:hypothetical protein